MIKRPGAVVFDCDGVLVDSEPHSLIAWLEVLDGFGHPATEADIEACIGLGYVPTHEFLSSIEPIPPPGDVWSSLLEALERSFRGGLEVFPDAVAVLDAAIAAELPVAVASASSRQRLDLTLGVAGLIERFAVSVAGDEVAAEKPDPAVYLAAIRALDRSASGVVAIEDSAAGATSAVRAGLDVIAIARHPADLAPLAAVGVRVVERLEPALLGL